MATAISQASNMPSRPTFSCIRCADRKVKCDRQNPCSACVKHNAECVFNLSQPPRKRRKGVKEQILTERLKQYEMLLQEQGIDTNKLQRPSRGTGPSTQMTWMSGSSTVAPTEEHAHGAIDTLATPKESQAQMPTPSSIDSDPGQTFHVTQVVQNQGRSTLVDNSLWTKLAEEVSDNSILLSSIARCAVITNRSFSTTTRKRLCELPLMM